MSNDITHSPLGKAATYISHYQKELLFPVPRKLNREQIGIRSSLPFKGVDVWNAFEISWLNLKGKPVVALGEFIFSAETDNLVESKSFKLYLNSFNNTQFESIEHVAAIMQRDLADVAKGEVAVNIIPIHQYPAKTLRSFSEIHLDEIDVSCDRYTTDPSYLQVGHEVVTETLYSDLLKSNCLVTGQPDWGSVQISYTGKKIQHDGLLKYIISFRDHNEFHEQCVERIFMDILQHCAPTKLTVHARYTRRGGLDINPFRSNHEDNVPENIRLARQ